MDKKTLDDIFADPIFNELISELPHKQSQKVDSEIEKFQEIINWIKSHDGKEPQKNKDMTERKLFSRLKGYREKTEMISKLAPIDELGLLAIKVEEQSTDDNPKTLDDILSDESLFEEGGKSKALLDLSRYKRTINAADKVSRRKHANHFEQYEPLFRLVQAELASGKRKLIDFSDYQVEANKFYVQNGVLLYVVSVGKHFTDKHGDDNAYLHIVYENGTENRKTLFRSLTASLYSKSRHGKMVTEVTSDVMGETTVQERAAEYITTGYIYVVKSLSDNPEIAKYHNLYKIGYAGESVEKRISDAENEATYLYAPVKIVATWEVQNFSARKLENALHHLLEDKQLKIEVPTANGEYESPSEWYIVDIEHVKDIVNKLIVDIQM
ncbi:GIY-YIG nuclease family protein [Lactovum odontotermitis]